MSGMEDFSASESEHESNSNESCDKGDDATDSVSSDFYYRKNRYKWSTYLALRGKKMSQHNIISTCNFPELIREA